MAIDIRDYQPDDASPLVTLWRESFEHGVGVVDFHPVEEQLAYLRETLVPNHRVRLAWDGDERVGFIAFTPESIAQLYVRVSRIGEGIGTRLLELAKAESSGRLWLFTFERNARARRFYKRNGFVAVAHGFEPNWQLADVKYAWGRPPAA